MTLPAFVSSAIHRFDHGQRLYSGLQMTIANNHTTSSKRVTKAIISEFLMQANATKYNAGLTKRYIAVGADDAAFTNVEIATADKPIKGVVVAAGMPKAAVPYESNVYDVNETSAEGEPIDVTVAFGGDSLWICEYDGTAPDPLATDETCKVVLSATAGLVTTPSTAALADTIGKEVIAVDTTLKLVVIKL